MPLASQSHNSGSIINPFVCSSFSEQSSDPERPAEGRACIWMSDGTGYGAAGDVCISSTTGGVTRRAILFTHSSGSIW